jgi:hypothetical protein
VKTGDYLILTGSPEDNMKSMRVMAIGLVVAGALACAALLVAQQQAGTQHAGKQEVMAMPASQPAELQTGISLVKTVVTAEIVYSGDHGSFVSWDELYQSPDTQKLWQPSSAQPNSPRLQISAGPEVIPGWTLSALASPDGKTFQVWARNSANQCGLSVLSNESGLIYAGGYWNCVQLEPAQK